MFYVYKYKNVIYIYKQYICTLYITYILYKQFIDKCKIHFAYFTYL